MWIELSRLESPLGGLVLALAERGVCLLEFAETEEAPRARLARSHPGARFESGKRGREIGSRIEAYFAGELGSLAEIPVAAVGTPFQERVWSALRTIPLGRTWSYQELARAVSSPGASRAVGSANGCNPVALIVPCHRVVGADGALRGYSAGVWRKEWLLAHEGAARRSTA